MKEETRGKSDPVYRSFKVSIANYDAWSLTLDLLGVERSTEDEEEEAVREFKSDRKPFYPIPGVSIRYEGDLLYEAVGDLSGVAIIVSLAENVAASLFCAWLYDKLKKNKAKRLTIENKQIEIEEGKIKRIVETIIKIDGD